MVRKLFCLLSVILCFPMLGLTAQNEDAVPDVKELIKEIDTLYRSEASFAELEMEIITPHWQRTLTMKSWTRLSVSVRLRADRSK